MSGLVVTSWGWSIWAMEASERYRCSLAAHSSCCSKSTTPTRRITELSSGEDPDHVGAPFDLLVDPLERIGRGDLAPVGSRERRMGGDVGRGLGLSEDRADRGGDHLLVGGADAGEDVSHGVDLAALPAGTGEHSGDRGFQAGVGVGDNPPHPGQAPILQRREERCPEHFVL